MLLRRLIVLTRGEVRFCGSISFGNKLLWNRKSCGRSKNQLMSHWSKPLILPFGCVPQKHPYCQKKQKETGIKRFYQPRNASVNKPHWYTCRNLLVIRRLVLMKSKIRAFNNNCKVFYNHLNRIRHVGHKDAIPRLF